ncbi:hypothetical protein Tco_0520127, partial [Tanacetum coccineum]
LGSKVKARKCEETNWIHIVWLDEIKLGGYCLTFKENGVNRECLEGLEKLPNDIGVYKSIDGRTEVTVEVPEMHVVDGKIVGHRLQHLIRLLSTPNIGAFARVEAMARRYIANTSCVSAINTPYGSATANAEAVVYTCNGKLRAQHSSYSNKLQNLNATFPLGVVTPTTSTEGSSSVVEDAITELAPINATAISVHMASLCAMTSDSKMF